ncbi:beta-eliminating lyase-related protein [Escherichia coli]|uniref:beta-eliminating lyase-related protein n=1 Tax=Escherichia coli TaxID=562 RepID=UPI0035D0358C
MAYGCELKENTQYCDSFTICLSKGLGTPAGALLVGKREYRKGSILCHKKTRCGIGMRGATADNAGYRMKKKVARVPPDPGK